MKRILILFSIVFMMIFNAPTASFAAGTLVDCDKSPAFTKRLNTSVKKLEGRLAKYKEGTPPYLALQQQIDQTKTRFDRYGKSGLLCGADGLPHLIVDGDFAHAPEFIIPGTNPEKSTNIAAAHTAIIADTLAIIPFNAKNVPARLPPVFNESRSTTSANIEAGRN